MQIFKTPISHRGLWNKVYPENSMGAFKNAVTNGYPIELDVQLTSDKKLIVFHDNTLERLTVCNSRVDEKTYSYIKELNIAGSKYTIPLFEEVLSEVDGKVPLLIEIKNTKTNDELCEILLKALEGYQGEFALQSFNPFIIKYIKDKNKEIVRGQLATFDYGKDVMKLNAFFLKRMMFNCKTKPHFVSYNIDNIPNKYLKKCKTKNIKVLSWTVRSQAEYDRIKEYTDNIIFEGFTPVTNK